MHNDPFDKAENACGIIVVVLTLIALYTAWGPTDWEVRDEKTPDQIATATASSEDTELP